MGGLVLLHRFPHVEFRAAPHMAPELAAPLVYPELWLLQPAQALKAVLIKGGCFQNAEEKSLWCLQGHFALTEGEASYPPELKQDFSCVVSCRAGKHKSS